MYNLHSALSSLIVLALPVLSHGAPLSAQASAESLQSTATSVTEGHLVDATLEPFQSELLQLAYNTASQFPLEPHIKNRSREQGRVAEACFELGAPYRAHGYIEGIVNWRRALGLADYAHYLASHSSSADIVSILEQAERLASRESGWRKRRILGSVGLAYGLLGDKQAVQGLAEGMGPAAGGQVSLALPVEPDVDECAAHIRWAEQTFLSGDLDLVNAAFKGCVRLYGSHYADLVQREALEVFILESIHKGPMDIGIHALLGMAETAAKNGEPTNGMNFVMQVEALIEGAEWLPEHEIPLVARIATVRFTCGDAVGASKKLQAMRTMFAEKRDVIVDVFRPDALIPLAEASYLIGERKTALELYSLAAEEGSLNPNSRPRVEDLVSICCSLARLAINPGEELMGDLRTMGGSVGSPW